MRGVRAAFVITLTVAGLIGANADGTRSKGFKDEPRIVSRIDAVVTDFAMTPDRKTMFFSQRGGKWGESNQPSTINIIHVRENGTQSDPKPAPFSGKYDDSDPFVSLNGRYLYFISTRPAPDKPEPDPDIWRLAITEDGFGTPERLPEPVNSTGVEYSPVTVASGALYFASTREGGFGQGDLYRAVATENGFAAPENLGPSVNSEHGEWNLYVTPAEDLLIFEGSGRADNVGKGSGDLYAALKVDGEWALTRNLKHINSTGSDLNPRLFPPSFSNLHYASSAIPQRPGHVGVVARPIAEVFAHFDNLLIVNRTVSALCGVTVPAFIRLGACLSTDGVGPHEIAVSPDGEWAYVPNHGVFPKWHDKAIAPDELEWVEEPGGPIVRIRTTSFEELDKWDLGPDCNRPHGVAVNDQKVWVTCEDSGTVRELSTERWGDKESVKLLNIGQKGVHEIILSPDGQTLVTANQGSGTVTLIDLETEQMTHLEVGNGPEGMAFAPGGKQLFVLNALSRSTSVVDLETRKVVKTVPTGGRFPIDIAVAAKAKEIWISHNASHELTILDLQTLREKQKIDLGTPPLGLILSDDEKWAFVTVPRRNQVWAYDTASRERRAVIPKMMEADGLAFVPAR